MRKQTSKQLQLTAETVRRLDSSDLAGVVGGARKDVEDVEDVEKERAKGVFPWAVPKHPQMTGAGAA